jgi:hypothetical protein
VSAPATQPTPEPPAPLTEAQELELSRAIGQINLGLKFPGFGQQLRHREEDSSNG